MNEGSEKYENKWEHAKRFKVLACFYMYIQV